MHWKAKFAIRFLSGGPNIFSSYRKVRVQSVIYIALNYPVVNTQYNSTYHQSLLKLEVWLATVARKLAFHINAFIGDVLCGMNFCSSRTSFHVTKFTIHRHVKNSPEAWVETGLPNASPESHKDHSKEEDSIIVDVIGRYFDRVITLKWKQLVKEAY